MPATPTVTPKPGPGPMPPVNRRLGRLLGGVFLLFGLLVINSLYLGAITVLETARGETYQDGFYLGMFLAHLALGLVLVAAFLAFAAGHYRRARHLPNRYAARAGKVLFAAAAAVLLSGLVLTRFGFLEVNDPALRGVAYWVHVLAPLAVAWLFVVHRLAGPPLRWRVGAAWAGAAVVLSAGLSLLQLSGPAPAAPDGTGLAPALSRVAGGVPIPPSSLMQDEVCAECHGDIADQAALSMHRLSSFNNPVYRFAVDTTRRELMARDGNVEGARLCATCHDQVPLFSGHFDDPDYDPDADPGGHAGIGCLGCHAITAVTRPRGNGAYDIAAPPRYPFASSEVPFLKAVNRQLIKAKPAFH